MDMLSSFFSQLDRDDCKIAGLILHSRSHAYLKKALDDPDFWDALDDISGDKLPIFAVKLKEGATKFPNFPPNTLGMMIPVWHEPAENSMLLETFGINDSKQPYFVVFCLDGDQLKHKVYKLDDSSKDKAFDSIKEIVTPIVKKIEVTKNTEETMKSIGSEIIKLKAKKVFGKILNLASTFRGVGGF